MSTAVEKIKERLHIEEVVSSYMKLDRAGKSLKGKCPFHNEKTPSFFVSPDRGTYYCFGCGVKGDIFSFVEQFEGLDFMGALKLLAERAGIDLEEERRKGGFGPAGAAASAAAKSEKERLYNIMEDAAKFYESALLGKNPIIDGNTTYTMAAIEAREYVKKRGITEETARRFRLGFAPAEWRLIYQHLRDKGYSEQDMEKAGLVKRPDGGGDDAGASATGTGGSTGGSKNRTPYDRFRDRIMFPIMDSSGRVIAFSGRIIHDDGNTAKYLNSPDTPLYNKSTVLYGIDKAKQDIRTRNYTILVEGQMDLVLSHQAGIRNTVAVSGTALADTLMSKDNVVNNLGVVRRLSPNLILAFDSDGAGRKAAMRSAEIALSLGMDVKVASMPEGKDPADMVLHDPESWKNVLRTATPVVEFQLSTVMADVAAKKLDPRKVPIALRERVLPFVTVLGGAMEKSSAIKLIHERTSIAEDAIRADLAVLERAFMEKNRAEIKAGGVTNGVSGAPSAGAFAAGRTGQPTPQNGIVSGIAQVTRLDMISRKLFGLLAYLRDRGTAVVADAKTPAATPIDVESIHASIRTLAGAERYDNLIQQTKPLESELILEAEIFFGSEKDIQKHIDELLLNFEEDIIKQDFSATMAELARIEKTADRPTMEALMKKCQSYGERLARISKKRQVS
ncbi:toprim domain-containing protein [bacterium]|nr:toprim domain-containing protein [bacterium]